MYTLNYYEKGPTVFLTFVIRKSRGPLNIVLTVFRDNWSIQKFHTVSLLFGWVSRPQTLWHHRGGHAHFPAENRMFKKTMF